MQEDKIKGRGKNLTKISLQYYPYWLFHFKTVIKGTFRSAIESIWFSVDDNRRRSFPSIVDPDALREGLPSADIVEFEMERDEAEKIARTGLLKREMKRRFLLRTPEITMVEYFQVYYPFWRSETGNKIKLIDARNGR